jgi:hypothetical protein
MAIERTSLPTSILLNPLLVKTSLHEVLDRAARRPLRPVQKVPAINLAIGQKPGCRGNSADPESPLAKVNYHTLKRQTGTGRGSDQDL